MRSYKRIRKFAKWERNLVTKSDWRFSICERIERWHIKSYKAVWIDGFPAEKNHIWTRKFEEIVQRNSEGADFLE